VHYSLAALINQFSALKEKTLLTIAYNVILIFVNSLGDGSSINFFLYDVLANFFSIFFVQIYSLLISMEHYKHLLCHAYTKISTNVSSDIRNLFYFKRSKLFTHHRVRQGDLVVLFNHKYLSVPHNGCRARKMRRK
jgi:hypothetical protein